MLDHVLLTTENQTLYNKIQVLYKLNMIKLY